MDVERQYCAKFVVHNVEVGPQRKAEDLKDYETYVSAMSPPPTDVTVVESGRNVLLRMVYEAFNKHYPVRFSPTMFWITVLNQLGIYVDRNAEALRHKFVQHDGKKTIEVHVKGSITDVNWSEQLARLADLVAANCLPGVADSLRVDFSDTAPIDRVVGDIMLMNAVKKYFVVGMMTMCGFPWIELAGTVDDWRKLRAQTDNLMQFVVDGDPDGFGNWVMNLGQIFDQFVEAAEGRPDIDFFGSTVTEGGGSGHGPMITGWIADLYLYDEQWYPCEPLAFKALAATKEMGGAAKQAEWRAQGKWYPKFRGREVSKFPGGLSQVTVMIDDDRQVLVSGGPMWLVQYPDGLLEVRSGWMVGQPKTRAEVEKRREEQNEWGFGWNSNEY